MKSGLLIFIISAGAMFVLAGCTLAPEGSADEKAKLDQNAAPYQKEFETRDLPEIPSPATWQDVLHRALLANGDLEASYFQWKAAMARLPQVATWPNTSFAPSYSYMFSGGNMKAWDRSTLGLQFDPSNNLELPNKTAKRGDIALADAQAAGAQFRAAKFELQRRVIESYLDIAMASERARIQSDNVALLKILSDTAADRVRAGANQQDLLRAQAQYRLAENELDNVRSRIRAMKAMLNGLLARDPRATLELAPGLPTPRHVNADDAKLIAIATAQNPELERLARDVQGRHDAIELAQMQYLPDINPLATIGGASQSLGAMIMLPTTIPQIRGMIDESRAALRSSQAMLRQSRHDRASSFVAALVAMRNAERQVQLFQETILPRADQTLASSRQAYATGTGTFIELIDAQRTLLDVRLLIVEARAEREKRLAELEELAGIDIETLADEQTARTPGSAEVH